VSLRDDSFNNAQWVINSGLTSASWDTIEPYASSLSVLRLLRCLVEQPYLLMNTLCHANSDLTLLSNLMLDVTQKDENNRDQFISSLTLLLFRLDLFCSVLYSGSLSSAAEPTSPTLLWSRLSLMARSHCCQPSLSISLRDRRRFVLENAVPANFLRLQQQTSLCHHPRGQLPVALVSFSRGKITPFLVRQFRFAMFSSAYTSLQLEWGIFLGLSVASSAVPYLIWYNASIKRAKQD
jgi:hypothetical protein